MRGKIGIDLAIGLGLRGAGAVSSFALLWLIARMAGADAVGAYQLGLTSATVLGVMAVAGLDVLIIREAARAEAGGAQADLRASFLAGRRLIVRTGGLLAMVMLAGGAAMTALWADNAGAALAIIAFVPAVPLLALLRHGNALLRSQGSVLLSQSLEGVFYTTLAAVIIAGFWLTDTPLALGLLPLPYLAGLAVAVAIGFCAASRMVHNWGEGTARLDIRAGLRATAAPLIMMGGEWLTLVLLGAIAGLAEAGIYRTAFQFCMLFQLVNASFATMAGTHIARAHAGGSRDAVLTTTRNVGLIGLALVAPLAAACLLAPQFLLGLFGPEFVAGALALQVLAAAQTVNVMFGPVGTALVMVGRERSVLWIEVAASGLAITLALALIPAMGLLGAAIGFAAGTVLRNVAARVMLSRWQPA
ncbi:MAG: oligosaccharide flippase family protein [Porphyrobacter sp.]|jgi:O-antigen/teichoic acid export membrane protein|nr:oligosaccharide flippase family protein [Porphyrobacter sp.]